MEHPNTPLCELIDCYAEDAVAVRAVLPVRIDSPHELADRLRDFVARESRVLRLEALNEPVAFALHVAIGGPLATIHVLPPPGGLMAVEALANHVWASEPHLFNHAGFDHDRPARLLMPPEEVIALAVHIVAYRELPTTHQWIDNRGEPYAPGPWPDPDATIGADIPF